MYWSGLSIIRSSKSHRDFTSFESLVSTNSTQMIYRHMLTQFIEEISVGYQVCLHGKDALLSIKVPYLMINLFHFEHVEPSSPVLSNITSTSVTMDWPLVTFSCSIESVRPMDHILYHIEMAISQHPHMHDQPEFLSIISQSDIRQAHITDLNPAMNYLLRLCVSYNGLISRSEAVSFATKPSCPSPPSKPRLYDNSLGENNFVSAKVSMMLRWSDNQANGSPITKYQVQLKQIYADGSVEPGDVRKQSSPSKYNKDRSPPIFMVSRLTSSHHKTATDVNNTDDNKNNTDTTAISEWKTIYSNKDNKCFLNEPLKGVEEWQIRVRSRNSLGWSDFSEIFVANIRNYPTVFGEQNGKVKSRQKRLYKYSSEEEAELTRINTAEDVTAQGHYLFERPLSNRSMQSFFSEVSVDSVIQPQGDLSKTV